MTRVLTLIVMFSLLIAAFATPGTARAERAAQVGPYEVTVSISQVAPSPSYVGQLVTLSVEVKANNLAAGTPDGQVYLTSSQQIVCLIDLDAAGQGTCPVTFTTPGATALKAVYLGTDRFLPGASPDLIHTVQARYATVVVIDARDPSPSVLNQVVSVEASVSSAGPTPTGGLVIYRSGADCASPPANSAADRCDAALAGGKGACSLPLTQAGAVTICAAYSGDIPNLPSTGKVVHWVSNSNTALEITRVEPSPSLLNQPAWVYFTLTSPLGQPPQDGLVTVTSGTEQCSGSLAAGRCALTFRQPHLQQVAAAYPGAAANQMIFEPSVSNVWEQRVNAAPTSLELSANRVDSFLPVGASVGAFLTVDPNPDETHTYSLVPGTGSAHNAYFDIDGSRLISKRGLPSGGGRLTIRVRATDPAGLFLENTFALEVIAGELPDTGFAPALVTRLPIQPAAKAYSSLDDLTIEIPRLGVSTAVLGVPWQADGWDATWLGWNAGWLNGTAFPTWQGNAVLVGHNFLPDGTAGPFARISTLKWGDRILIRAFGAAAAYEVRTVEPLQPGDSSALRHETNAWLTLITCQNFDEELQTYRSRVVVRAVLVEMLDASH